MNEKSKLDSILTRVASVMNSSPVSSKIVARGYTSAHRLLVELSNGLNVFVKAASDPLTAEWLRTENIIYSNIFGSFMANKIGWHDDGDMPLLILEDLSEGRWSHDWTPESIATVLTTLTEVRRTVPPQVLARLESSRSDLASWRLVEANPEPFLNLDLCSESWLAEALPTLIAAEDNAVLDGSQLTHLDIRSDNLCFIGNRLVIVDWNWASIGNASIDLHFWLPSVALEGGPSPEQIIDGDPALVSLIAGFWAHRAGQPPPPLESAVREIQRRQLEIALPWSARLLDLPEPQGKRRQLLP